MLTAITPSTPGRLEQSIADLLLRRVGALRRCAVGKLQREEHVALIFRGDESAGQAASEIDRHDRNQDEADHGKAGLVDEHARGADKAVGGAAEELVEETESSAERGSSCGPLAWA